MKMKNEKPKVLDLQKQIHIKLPENLHRKLKIQAASSDTTIQEYVVKAIISQLNKNYIESK